MNFWPKPDPHNVRTKTRALLLWASLLLLLTVSAAYHMKLDCSCPDGHHSPQK